MPAVPLAGRLVEAQTDLTQACDLLVAATPEALRQCQQSLRQAISHLAEAQAADGALFGPGLRNLAQNLRADVLRSRRLLENLAVFHQGWERILATMSGGYTPSGNPVPL